MIFLPLSTIDKGQPEDDPEKEPEDDEEKIETIDEEEKPASFQARGQGMNAGRGAPFDGPVRVRLPNKKENEIFGIADQLLGASRIKIMCADGKSRMGRIPGKLKKRMWIRVGDLVIVRPWKFQDDKSDIVWRYTKTQASYLSRRKMIPDTINIF